MEEKKKFTLKRIGLFILIAAALIVAYIFLVRPLVKNSKAIGEKIGEESGKLTGMAIGSYKGITEGLDQGYDAGKEEGLSAEDTMAKMAETIENMGRLEVLVAGVRLQNCHSIGDDYAALYILKGDAVFTVDLTEAVISYSADGADLVILLPQPEMELYIDDSQTELLAEYQKTPFSGKAEDGFTAYLNSMSQTVEEIKDTMVDYENLLAQARDSAVTQVSMLAEAAGSGRKISVEFMQ